MNAAAFAAGRFLLVLFFAIVAESPPVSGQDSVVTRTAPPMQVTLEWIAGSHPRGPVWVRAEFRNGGPQQQGRLRLVGEHGSNTSREVVVPEGNFTFDWVLDPTIFSRWRDTGDGMLFSTIPSVDICWLVNDPEGEGLTENVVGEGRVQPVNGSRMSVLRCRDPNRVAALDPLFDEWRKEESARARGMSALSSALAVRDFSAQEFPEQPLSLCCFDTIFVGSRAFSELSPQQTRALLSWVNAGGVACVEVRSQLRADQVAELARFAQVSEEALFESDSVGLRRWGEAWGDNGVLSVAGDRGIALFCTEALSAFAAGEDCAALARRLVSLVYGPHRCR